MTVRPAGRPPAASAAPPDQPAAAAALAAALGEALAAEHAAVYAYGPIGVRLGGEWADAAREAEAVHRQRRDALVLSLAGRGVAAPAPYPAYQFPFPVEDEDGALRLAVLVEERVAAVWRAVLARSPAPEGPDQPAGTPSGRGDAPPDRGDAPPDRETALSALVAAAVWAARWRTAAGLQPATVAFPGEQ